MKENLNIGNQKSIHHQLLKLLESTAYQQEFYFTSELFFFFLQYSFLFKDNDKTQKTCDLKTTHFLVPQGNGENGARYLDPKYSRWISVDPALSDFVSGNSNGSSGGIYNPTNLNLYHYGNNNPIKYVDPDGKDWLCRTVDDVQEYFYRADITTNEQARKEYGKSAFVLFNGYDFNGYRFYNGNGNPYMTDSSGKRINRTKPIHGSDFDIFPGSASKKGVDPDTLHNNL